MAGVSDQLRLHRFSARLDGRTYAVMTPRPSLKCRFATNNYHDTWHILGDASGGAFLAELFWWLSYQTAPNSVVVIDDAMLVPNPFDADPSSPVAIFSADATHLGRRATDDLRSILRRKPRSEGTVRVSTPSFGKRQETPMMPVWDNRIRDFKLTDRVNGVIRVSASPELFRRWSVYLGDLCGGYYRGTIHSYLDSGRLERYPDGEVQLFQFFSAMVNDAVALRKQLFPGTSHRELLESERRIVHSALPDRHIDRDGGG
jgi:hypothetical protein